LNIKSKFQALKTFQKIEIYIIVLILYSFIVVFSSDIVTFIKPHSLSNITHTTLKTKQYANTYIRMDDISLMNYIDTLSREKNTTILESKILKKSMYVKTEANHSEIMEFLTTIENHFVINNFELIEENEQTILNIMIDTNYFYKSPMTTKRVKNPNPFFQNKIKKQKVNNVDTKLKITAIISNEVLIDAIWYKEGDSVRNFKILLIFKDKVQFKNLITKQIVTEKVSYDQ